ncbi:MAG: hypothetical protein KatS3mg105_1453 [Gemmatales bacterium]|nr:MAG: hypothetical protein KatS3mg105_1453 [Gemmatales bacterium]
MLVRTGSTVRGAAGKTRPHFGQRTAAPRTTGFVVRFARQPGHVVADTRACLSGNADANFVLPADFSSGLRRRSNFRHRGQRSNEFDATLAGILSLPRQPGQANTDRASTRAGKTLAHRAHRTGLPAATGDFSTSLVRQAGQVQAVTNRELDPRFASLVTCRLRRIRNLRGFRQWGHDSAAPAGIGLSALSTRWHDGQRNRPVNRGTDSFVVRGRTVEREVDLSPTGKIALHWAHLIRRPGRSRPR